jgi:diguanylate cyclase (GGDEF)-like protein/PAS domain S-box-containing protein
VIDAPASPVTAGTALRAVIDVADEALDVAASEERVLCVGVSGITSVLGDRCSISLTATAVSDLPTVASSHPDPIEADLEEFVATLTPTGTTVYTADGPNGGWLTRHDLRQAIVAPVLVRGQTIGTFVVTRCSKRPPLSVADLDFTAAMADIVGIAVQTSRVRNDAMVTVEELRQQVDVTESISDALIACDPTHLILSWNSGAEKIYGYTRDEAVGCHLFTLLATDFFTAEGAQYAPDEVFAQVAERGQWSGEQRERRADGTPLVVLSSITEMADGLGTPNGIVVVSRDITTQRREEYQAMHDALTGLPNRRMLNSKLYEAVARACRTDHPLAVLFIDLDGFKPINDTYGHAAGDVVLTATAQRLSAAVRSRDTVGRLGGDEFLVILEEAGSEQQIARAAARITAALSEPILVVDGAKVTVLPSIGVCIAEHPAEETIPAERMLNAADQAMYVAKREKRGTVFVNPH